MSNGSPDGPRRSAIDLSLIAELNLNDIKGVDAPSLDAWSTAAALDGRDKHARADGRGAADVS